MTAIRATDAPSSKRIATEPKLISERFASLVGGSETGGSIITAANSTGSSGARRISFPCFYRRWPRRQVSRLQAVLRPHSPSHGARGSQQRSAPRLIRSVPVSLKSRLPRGENLPPFVHRKPITDERAVHNVGADHPSVSPRQVHKRTLASVHLHLSRCMANFSWDIQWCRASPSGRAAFCRNGNRAP